MVAFREWLDRLITISLCAMVFTIPFSKSAVEACFIASLVLWALKKILSYEPYVSASQLFKQIFSGLNLPVYLFVLIGLISTCYSVSLPLSLKGFFSKLMEGVLLFFIAADHIDSRKKINLILISLSLSICLISVDGIFQFITGRDFIRHYPSWGPRIQASFSNPNGFGGWLVVMLPLVLSFVFINKDLWSKIAVKIIIWASMCILAFCLLMTYSRGAWIGVVLALLFFGIFKKSKLLMIMIPVLIALPLILPIPIKTRIMNALPFTISYSIKGRLESIGSLAEPIRGSLWREAMAIVKDFPAFGCGLNTYSVVAPHYKGSGTKAGIYPHNSYLQMAAETGIVGLASFIMLIMALFITSLMNVIRIRDTFYKNILLGLLSGLFGFLVHSFFDVHFYALQLATLMWFVMGLIMAVQNTALKEQSA